MTAVYAMLSEFPSAKHISKYVWHWDPTFAQYLAKKRAEGKHYNVAISHAVKNWFESFIILKNRINNTSKQLNQS